MPITETEINYIDKYFREPFLIIDKNRFFYLLENGYPDGTKITRSYVGKNGVRYRYLIIPQGMDIDELRWKFEINPDDIGQFSCTIIAMKAIYHAHTQDNRKTTYYKDSFEKNGVFSVKKVVKPAEDRRGNRYYFNSTSSTRRSLRPLNPEVRKRVGYFSESEIFRTTKDYYKKIDITPFFGISLQDYLCQHQELTPDKKTEFADLILSAYIVQIANNDIVHTDINPRNICIDEQTTEKKLQFIDFEESFIIGNPSNGLERRMI